MSLRDHNTATPEAIKNLAEMNLDMSVKIKQLQDRLSEAEKVIDDLLTGNDRMFIQLGKQKRNLVYIHNSDEPSVTKDNLRAEALVIASNIGHELEGENFWNIKPSIKRAREYQAKWKEVL